MKVNLGILIGQNPVKWASKTIELSFAPVVGMHYDDGTWKDTGGREIIEVRIEALPNDTPSLSVALKPDDTNALDVLTPIYEAHEWKIT